MYDHVLAHCGQDVADLVYRTYDQRNIMRRDTPVSPSEARDCPRCGKKVLDRRTWNGDPPGAWVPALYHKDCGAKFMTDEVARVFKGYLDEHHPLPPGKRWVRVHEPAEDRST